MGTVYTDREGSKSPLTDTANTFVLSIPAAAVLGIVGWNRSSPVHTDGILLAVASGALASGAGYAIWYAALRNLSITQAAVVQLGAPIIAALGGVLFLEERLTVRFGGAAAMILGGILLVTLGKSTSPNLRQSK